MNKALLLATTVLFLAACSQESSGPPLHSTLNATGSYTGSITNSGVTSDAVLSGTSQDETGKLTAQFTVEGLSCKSILTGSVDSGILSTGDTTNGAILTGTYTLFGTAGQTGSFNFAKQ